jgi:hypothetical protein
MELKIVLSDLQLPYHDKRAVAAVCNLLADRAASIVEVHQVGDFFDFTGISRWVDGTVGESGLQKELDASRSVQADLHSAYGGKKTRILGNHDDRLRKYLSLKAKGLHGLRVLGYDYVTEAQRYGWETVPEPYMVAPGVASVHGLSVRSKAGYTAQAHLDRVDSNVIHGHTHRAALVHRTVGSRTRWAMEVGCLMDFGAASYAPGGFVDWQQAIAALYVDGKDVTPVLVQLKTDRSLVFEGKRYRP